MGDEDIRRHLGRGYVTGGNCTHTLQSIPLDVGTNLLLTYFLIVLYMEYNFHKGCLGLWYNVSKIDIRHVDPKPHQRP